MREKILISNLDIQILKFLTTERNITEIVDEFRFGFSQCKKHINRIQGYISKRNYGTFVFLKINERGKKLLEIWT